MLIVISIYFRNWTQKAKKRPRLWLLAKVRLKSKQQGGFPKEDIDDEIGYKEKTFSAKRSFKNIIFLQGPENSVGKCFLQEL